MKTAYFILGMHRSGTSAIGGVLNIMGLEFGSDLMKANDANPKGYFENNLVYELNEKILSENQSSWDDYHLNFDNISTDKRNAYTEKAKEIIEEEFRYAENFVIKDPRICLLFPIWEKACVSLGIEIKVILPYRNPMEVANSLRKRNGFSIEKGLILWSQHFLSAEFLSRKYERIFISFDDLLSDTKKEVDSLYAFTAFKGQRKRKEVDDFLDKNVKHNNISINNFTKETPLFLQKLLTFLRKSNFDALDTIDKIRDDFRYSLEMFQHAEVIQSLANEKIQSTNLAESSQLLEQRAQELDAQGNTIQELQTQKAGLEQSYQERVKETETLNQTLNETTKSLEAQQHTNGELIAQNSGQHQLLEQRAQELDAQGNTIQELQTQKAGLEQTYQERVKETETLNQTLNETTKSLKIQQNSNSELNSKNSEQSKQLEEKIQTLENKESTIKELQSQTSKLENTLDERDLAVETKSKEIVLLNKNIDAMQKKKIKLEQIHQENLLKLQVKQKDIKQDLTVKQKELELKTDEISTLNKNIDEIVNDLASVKESKCWIYTKPIRDLQKVIKGSDV